METATARTAQGPKHNYEFYQIYYQTELGL